MAQTAATSADSQRPPYLNISIEQAHLDDIDDLVRIAGASFEADTHTQLQSHFKAAGDSDSDGTKESLTSYLTHPKVDLLVARDVSSGRPVGSIAWARRGYQGDVDYPLDEPSDRETKEGPKTMADLSSLTDHAMDQFMSQMMPQGSRCRYIVGINVDPAYQGKGVGSRLIQWGTDKADSERVRCWVSSSMGGHLAFQKQGFREISRVEANLDDYAEGVRPAAGQGSKDGSWGKYTWYYLERLPKV
jgi:GNAT superfamily N-acetyltransferase